MAGHHRLDDGAKLQVSEFTLHYRRPPVASHRLAFESVPQKSLTDGWAPDNFNHESKACCFHRLIMMSYTKFLYTRFPLLGFANK